MREFGLTVERLGPEVFCVALRGELDMNRAYTLDAELLLVEDARPDTLVLDLRELRFVDSAGIARILAAQRRARRDGRRLVIVRGAPAVQRLFAMTALDQTLELVGEPEAALA